MGDSFHATVSQASLVGVGKRIPEIVGCHHGDSPRIVNPNESEIYGGLNWQKQREALIVELLAYFQENWPQVSDDLKALVIAGLTTVSDWIGSGSDFETVQTDRSTWITKIPLALDKAGYIFPTVKKNLSFKEIFSFPERLAQTKLIQSVTQSGVYVLEAPMGMGKTEAALFAAYKVLEVVQATGIYFALPTQLTSNKIHERVTSFLDKILENSDQKKVHLVHGASWMYSETHEMGENGQPGGSWFDGRKRGLLAPFAVGTIDQALMAVMNVKHGFVRTFGLLGKVVILDEVHSYDSYTGTILDTFIMALRQLHCTVIILSATLTQERRLALLGSTNPENLSSTEYPLITAMPLIGQSFEAVVESTVQDFVTIHRESQDIVALEEALKRAEEGQQVLWIENTVGEVQDIYKIIAARAREMNIEVGLAHSRFIKKDRESHEDYWVSLYGKSGKHHRSLNGRILVGTQVLEQSLDIDADFLITRLAPTDMLLQRIGRLWRHTETNRPKGAKQEVWILSQSLEDVLSNYKTTLGNTRFVYDPFILCRSLEIWENKKHIFLPKDLRSVIEATYLEREETEILSKLKQELKTNREKLERLALHGLSKLGTTLPETAATRYSDRESCEVLLLRSIKKITEGFQLTLLNRDSLILPSNIKRLSRPAWKKIAIELAKQTVMVSEKQAPSPVIRKSLNWLKDYIYLGTEENSIIRIGLVNEEGEIMGMNKEKSLAGWKLSYDDKIGYSGEKETIKTGEDEGW